MRDKTLIKISILTTLIGIISLFIINKNTTPLEATELSEKLLNKEIIIQVKITNIKELEKLTVINIETYTSDIESIIYKTNLDLKTDTKIKAKGIVKEYKNKLQLQINEISTN